MSTSDHEVLIVDGAVERPLRLAFANLESLAAEHGATDVSRFDTKRKGDAVSLSSLIALAGVLDTATHLGLHGSLDNFHASIPLAPVRDRGLLIFRLDGRPLDMKAGGPFRFFIRDHAACHTAEIDECANVKFVDHIEFTVGKGFDNRPEDDEAHAQLHHPQ